MRKHKRLLCAALAVVSMGSVSLNTGVEVKADQIKSADVFADAQWNYLTEWTVDGERDWLQSMCETDKYIVCYTDTKKKGEPDVITVFDRETLNLAFEVREMDYEHGNGMTYNARTNEIYLAPYNTQLRQNAGYIFALDADTMEFKRRIKISDGSFNAASIEYVEGTNQYIIQTTKERNYTFLLYDSDFVEIETLFEGNQSMGNLFQDFCVSGDFIISVPWMRKNEDDPRLQLYSISQREYLGSYSIYAPGAGEVYEPESICQSAAGEIVLALAMTGTKRMALYNTYVPIIYTVTTSVENGEITETRGDVDMGSDFRVEYNSTEDFELRQVQVDGQNVGLEENKDGYTFGNIQDDHSIWAQFTEIPKFDIVTDVENGTIDGAQAVRRDEDITINYAPEEHYEMDQILVDGEPVYTENHEDSYTFKFVQEARSIAVKFKEIPSFVIATKAYNGDITATNNKVYRDENYTVEYSPNDGYQMSYMKIDGEWLSQIGTDTDGSSYTFENVQSGHDVTVVYQWKYLPFIILAGAFGACIPLGLIYLTVARIQKKRRKRRLRRTGNDER